MSIELSKIGIDHTAIAEAYGYKPVPEGFQEIPPADVVIDWETGAEQRKVDQREAMKNFDTSRLHQSQENKGRREALLGNTIIPTHNGSLSLTIDAWVYKDGIRYLRLHLVDRHANAEVGQYLSEKRGNIWNMNDRATSEAYRGKGVASHMIQATENCVQGYADRTGEDQIIEMTASQLPVLRVFLKEGYDVVEEDKQRFAEVIQKLGAGDQKYVLASCESDFQNPLTLERKTWYVFEREIFERFGSAIWDYDETTRKSNYMQYSVRFRLRKKIEGRSEGVTRVADATRRGVVDVAKS